MELGVALARPARMALRVVQNRRGAVPRPSFCTYLVTYRCNARCKMCDSWRMKPGDELTPAQVRTVFLKVGALDVVRISGGEPFLREDLLDVAHAIVEASRPAVVHITTNGSFCDRVRVFVQNFRGPSRLEFMVSFDGLAPEHNESRGPEVTFAQALNTVRTLAEMGTAVTVNHTVISAQSLQDHDGIRKAVEPLGVDVMSVLAYEASSMYGIKLRGKRAEHLIVPRGYPLHPNLRGSDVKGFVRRELARVPHMKRASVRIAKRYYLRGLLARLEGPDSDETLQRPSCVALRSHLRLLPDGRVPVCQFNTEVVGDLREQSLDEVWHSASAISSRAWVDACPGCWAECEVVPSAMYTGDIVRALV